MIKGLEYALKRPLTEQEQRVAEWLMGWEKSTQNTVESLFHDLYKAGQVDGHKASQMKEGKI